MSKIFISGSREINDYEVVATHLLNVISDDDIVLVGKCEGVDTLVQKFCDDDKEDTNPIHIDTMKEDDVKLFIQSFGEQI